MAFMSHLEGLRLAKQSYRVFLTHGFTSQEYSGHRSTKVCVTDNYGTYVTVDYRPDASSWQTRRYAVRKTWSN